MKIRWLLFAVSLPTDDVVFVQYTVPTIVMSRQCDQTARVIPSTRRDQSSHALFTTRYIGYGNDGRVVLLATCDGRQYLAILLTEGGSI